MSSPVHDFRPHALPINKFAREQGTLEGHGSLQEWSRLLAEHEAHWVEASDNGDAASGLPEVAWQAQGEYMESRGIRSGAWLFVRGRTSIVKTCQRCLEPVQLNLEFDRAYRFVRSEEEAEALDMESEEDVLAYVDDFNVLQLVEDELLLAIPAIPRHESCGGSIQYEWMDSDFDATQVEKKNPFAVLEQLKKKS